MSDDELRARLENMQAYIDVLAGAIAQQQIAILRMMALQEAHYAAIRHLLVSRFGEDRTILGQRIDGAYEISLNQYRVLFAQFQQDGDVKKFLRSLVFPDEIQGN